MKFSIFLSVLTLFSVASCFQLNIFDKKDKTTTSEENTTVWVTLTKNGQATTLPSHYSQSFMTTFSTAESVPSGTVGVGLLSGKVGDQRSYPHSTINGASTLYGGLFGWACIVLGYLL